MNKQSDNTNSQEEEKGLTIWQVFGSVISSFLGVQKKSNQERDFKHGKPSQFIIVGLVLTFVFILLMIGLVQIALKFAGV